MIYGIGTDLVVISRFQTFLERHGERALEKLLAPAEREPCRTCADPGRFLAKRFAAKEALGKALGTGIRAPVLLPAIAVAHDGLGKPVYRFSAGLEAWMEARGLVSHLSLSDEAEHVLAFAVVEKVMEPLI
jgi:holo-[acyl-carrier protein] synthase